MEYISLSLYDIPELVVPIRISLIAVAANKEATESRFPLVKLKSSLRKFYGGHHDLVGRYGILVSEMTTDMLHLSKHFPVLSSFTTYHRVCN